MNGHYVNKNGHNAYKTIQEAINVAEAGDEILVASGVYKEKISLTTPGVTLRGSAADQCIISWQDYALKDHEDGCSYGTFRSYTCLLQGDDIKLENITIENKAGDGREVGQAIALYVDGDRISINNCCLIGHQDTLFTGPLPLSPKIPGSFTGPSMDHVYRQQRHYYHHCSIIGDVDYIFGSALAVFNGCSLLTRNRGLKVNGYVTAPSTWQGEPYGYVFYQCEFKGEEGIEPASVFLSRPWREYGQVKLIDCKLDGSIHEALWDPWGSIEHFKTTTFDLLTNASMEFLDPWHINQLKNQALKGNK